MLQQNSQTIPFDSHHQAILDEIEMLRRELAERRARPAGRSVVLAYHALLERQYARLDDLTGPREVSINVP